MPLAYKIRPYLGTCGNSEDQLTYLYYYPYLFKYVPVYLLAQFAVLRVARSNRAVCASLTNGLRNSHILKKLQ